MLKVIRYYSMRRAFALALMLLLFGSVANDAALLTKDGSGVVRAASCTDLSDCFQTTFTPQLNFGGANTGMVQSSQTGTCTKIYKLVRCEFLIIIGTKGTATGAVTITGFPYAAVGTAGLVVPYDTAITHSSGPLQGYMQGSSTLILGQSTSGGMTALLDTAFIVGSVLYGEITFATAS